MAEFVGYRMLAIRPTEICKNYRIVRILMSLVIRASDTLEFPAKSNVRHGVAASDRTPPCE